MSTQWDGHPVVGDRAYAHIEVSELIDGFAEQGRGFEPELARDVRSAFFEFVTAKADVADPFDAALFFGDAPRISDEGVVSLAKHPNEMQPGILLGVQPEEVKSIGRMPTVLVVKNDLVVSENKLGMISRTALLSSKNEFTHKIRGFMQSNEDDASPHDDVLPDETGSEYEMPTTATDAIDSLIFEGTSGPVLHQPRFSVAWDAANDTHNAFTKSIMGFMLSTMPVDGWAHIMETLEHLQDVPPRAVDWKWLPEEFV